MSLKSIIFVLLVFQIFIMIGLPAHEITGGTITYQAIHRYDFQTTFAEFAAEYPDWVNLEGNLSNRFPENY